MRWGEGDVPQQTKHGSLSIPAEAGRRQERVREKTALSVKVEGMACCGRLTLLKG